MGGREHQGQVVCDVYHVIVTCGLIQTLVNLFILGSSRLTHPIFLRLQYSGDTFSTLPLILVSNILLLVPFCSHWHLVLSDWTEKRH